MLKEFCVLAVFGYGLSTYFIDSFDEIHGVRIGGQVWMKNNLNVTFYLNGDSIPHVQNSQDWSNLTTGAWCYVDENKTKYGRIYNWYAVNDNRKSMKCLLENSKVL